VVCPGGSTAYHNNLKTTSRQLLALWTTDCRLARSKLTLPAQRDGRAPELVADALPGSPVTVCEEKMEKLGSCWVPSQRLMNVLEGGRNTAFKA